jgi:hypothetical protein
MSLFDKILGKKEPEKTEFMDYSRDQMDEYLRSLPVEEIHEGWRTDGWRFNEHSPGVTPLNMALRMFELGYSDDSILDSVPRAFTGVRDDQIRGALRYLHSRKDNSR